MNKRGPIIVIEDDIDDQLILADVFKELNFKNEIRFFGEGDEALQYLKKADIHPFLILSDVNMPKINGFELRKMVHSTEGLSQKCIPYLFFTTSADSKAVIDAYTMSVQGYFVKPTNYAHLVRTIRLMIEYWRECYSPNDYSED